MNAVNSPIDIQRRSAGRHAIARAWTFAHALLALLGLAVCIAMAFPATREAVSRQAAEALRATEPAGVVNFAAGPIQSTTDPTKVEREQRAITEMLAKRYRVAQEAVGGFVVAAYRVGKETAVDPLLILAVISVESKFNPVAESTFGARGLMQIIPRFHKEKLIEHGGDESLLDPEINILVGAQVLREYMRRFGGTESALQAYTGAFDDEAGSHYASKVLSERSRIEQAVARLRRAT